MKHTLEVQAFDDVLDENVMFIIGFPLNLIYCLRQFSSLDFHSRFPNFARANFLKLNKSAAQLKVVVQSFRFQTEMSRF